jgi:GAF domain-containing protein
MDSEHETIALLEAGSREELARALLSIALQRSRAAAGAVLFNEDSRFTPFATSAWGDRTVKIASPALPASFPLDLGALDHAENVPDPISMNEVVSACDGESIGLSIVWIPLKYRDETVGLIYLETDRASQSSQASLIEEFKSVALQAASAFSNLRLNESLEREMRLKQAAEACRDEIHETVLQHQRLGRTGNF